MNPDPSAIINETQARALMAKLGKAEGEFIASLTTPL